MKSLRHVAIDLETMATKPGAAIVSIGAVLFDPRYGKISSNTFYEELDWEGQGRLIDPGTAEWWGRQSPTAKTALDGLEDLPETLTALAKWLPKDCRVWGNGPLFDMGILENAYDQHNLEVPWKFWNVRCCRTIKDLYESSRGGYDKKAGGTLHNALDDAKFEAQYITEMWNKILAGGA